MGKGVPIVLLHSAMSSRLQWYFLMRAMSKDYLLAAVDFFGCGESPFPVNTETFSLSDEIALVNSLLDGIIPPGEPFHLVGHSYGGAVALRFCYGDRKRIRSLTLFEPVAYHLLPGTDEALGEVRKTADVVRNYIDQGNYGGAAEYFIDYWNGAGTFSYYPKEMRDILAEGAKKMPLNYRALMNEPLSLEDYREITTPTCLIAGKQSPISSRRVAELLVDYLPGCRIHWIDAGHMAPINETQRVNPIIEHFIRSIK